MTNPIPSIDEGALMRIIGVDAGDTGSDAEHLVLSALRDDGRIARFRVDLPTAEPLRIALEYGINKLLLAATERNSVMPGVRFEMPIEPSADLIGARAVATDAGTVILSLTLREAGATPTAPSPTVNAIAALGVAETALASLSAAVETQRGRMRRAH
jgi:hypothetical protein